ncbi:hypothetical protein UA08_06618 [Talaromyces atroroseus]|uniref:Mid2 domain-containing protein n=1 Tax=Talaromyces atroroseus TaxID=1441469 RepID=A0A225AIK6_TALAT|nr:hypothetical protein UA08_06618 [Talaromyces atroroseus]OKL58084.1 hypothetical protein UA08_06618 [Talaromyces atroroseus]
MRTHWLVILAMASATTAWPWKPAVSPSTPRRSGDIIFVSSAVYDQNAEQLYARDTASTLSTTTSTAADSTTTSSSATTSTSSATTASTASSTETSSTSSTTSGSTATTSSTSTSASTVTAASTTSATTTASSSTVSTTATTSSTSTASTTTTTTTATTSTSTSNASASASAEAAAELAAWNHAGEMRAIIVFSILGGITLGFTLYRIIQCYMRKRRARVNRYSTASASTYSVIPLTAAADGKDARMPHE